MDRNRDRRQEGETVRYGAGESYRPFNRDRSPPRRPRSPLREDRDRDDRSWGNSNVNRDRPRTPRGVGGSNFGRERSPPRRRSRSPPRFQQRDRSRGSAGGWRGRERSRSRFRSPVRRASPRRSPLRRATPPRYSPRRDDRFGGRQSPPRRDLDARDDRHRSPSPHSRRPPARISPRRSPPSMTRGGSLRPRSRSAGRGGRFSGRDAFPRDTAISSGMNSAAASRLSSPRAPSHRGRDDFSRPHSPSARSPGGYRTANSIPVRSITPRHEPNDRPTPRSPPRGPAAARGTPTGPRDSRRFDDASAVSSAPPVRRAASPGFAPSRQDVPSPSAPPSGPRGYNAPPRGGFGPRGGRGGAWAGRDVGSRHGSIGGGPGPSPTSATPASDSRPRDIPSGPRASTLNHSSASPAPSSASKPFNPPTGPSSQSASSRPTLAQQLIASMPPIIPGGRIDPAQVPMTTGVLPKFETNHKRLQEEEEKLRAKMNAAQDKLRHSLREWERLDRESKAAALRSDLSEKALKNIAGEGVGGAAF